MYNLVELFSGIGSQAKALKNLGVEVNVLGTCEWDIQATAAYDSIHESPYPIESVEHLTKNELISKLRNYTLSHDGKTKLESLNSLTEAGLRRILSAIYRTNNYVDVSSLKGSLLPNNIDILTYSFPCQDLSNVGAFHGYNKGIDKNSGSRSSLLWQVGRILSEMRENGKSMPRYLLMENVPTLLSERHYPNFMMWIDQLRELGYVSGYYQLNAKDFGLPQNRPRLIMLSIYCGDDEILNRKAEEFFLFTKAETIISDYKSSPHYKNIEIRDLLRNDYSNTKLFAEAVECTPNNTPSRMRIWNENPQLVLENGDFNKKLKYVRTITTKQDRNPNSGNLHIETGIEGRAKFRYLTPRECLLFQGFEDEDYEKLICNNIEFRSGHELFPRDKIIRLAGNSIPVKLLEGVFWQIIQFDKQNQNCAWGSML